MQLSCRTLGEICDEAKGVIRTGPFGSQLHESDYTEEGIPVVMPKNIIDGRVSVEGIARIHEVNVFRLAQHKLHIGCKIRLEIQHESGLKSGITEVYSTVSKLLWRQRGCSVTWNDQPFTT